MKKTDAERIKRARLAGATGSDELILDVINEIAREHQKVNKMIRANERFYALHDMTEAARMKKEAEAYAVKSEFDKWLAKMPKTIWNNYDPMSHKTLEDLKFVAQRYIPTGNISKSNI